MRKKRVQKGRENRKEKGEKKRRSKMAKREKGTGEKKMRQRRKNSFTKFERLFQSKNWVNLIVRSLGEEKRKRSERREKKKDGRI